MKLFWWRKVPNTGDYLSPYIVEALVLHKIIHGNRNICFFSYIKNRIAVLCRFTNWKIGYVWPFEKNLFAVGSILQWTKKQDIVWGAGFLESGFHCPTKKIYAVRGYLTLKELDFPHNNIVVGDPALLLPLIYNKPKEKRFTVKLIPHWSDYSDSCNKYSKELCIDMNTTDVEAVIDQIRECKYILSSSLHGLIIAHAYGIPALWVHTSEDYQKPFKYLDYFSSVNIVPYEGFNNIGELMRAPRTVVDFFKEHSTIATIQSNLSILQRDLLRVFPYKIKNETIWHWLVS